MKDFLKEMFKKRETKAAFVSLVGIGLVEWFDVPDKMAGPFEVLIVGGFFTYLSMKTVKTVKHRRKYKKVRK
jgi:hypothetical protein